MNHWFIFHTQTSQFHVLPANQRRPMHIVQRVMILLPFGRIFIENKRLCFMVEDARMQKNWRKLEFAFAQVSIKNLVGLTFGGDDGCIFLVGFFIVKAVKTVDFLLLTRFGREYAFEFIGEESVLW